MKKLRLLTVFACLFLFSGNALAAIRPYALSLTPFAGGYVFEGNQRLKDRPVYGLAVGYNLNERWGLEGVASYIESEVTEGEEDNVDLYLVHVDLLYHFQPDKPFVPYAAAGLGGLSIHPGGESDEDFLFNYGLGFKYFLSEDVALRADARHLLDINYNDENRKHDFFNNLSYTAGVTFQFGGTSDRSKELRLPKDTDGDGVVDQFDRCPDTKLGVPVDGFGCPLDSDHDGVVEFADRCPDTPMGVKVDQRGCPPDTDEDGVFDHLDQCPGTPAGTVVDSKGCPQVDAPPDGDGDGVEDGRDKCPNTPAEVPVNPYGCPRDSDNDGVFDFEDLCPGTAAGTPVGADGCPIPPAPAPAPIPEPGPVSKPPSLTLQLEFDTGNATIRPNSAKRLQEAADFIKSYPGSRILIEGHTDSVGSSENNMGLSQQRAESVRKYLIENFDVAPQRLEAKGFGETRPVADNSTPEGRQKNRRVEIIALPQP